MGASKHKISSLLAIQNIICNKVEDAIMIACNNNLMGKLINELHKSQNKTVLKEIW